MSHREPQGQWQSGPILVKLAFNWDAQDRYIELINFEMEILNSLVTKYMIIKSEEVKASVIKIGWAGRTCRLYKCSFRKRK